MSELEDQLNSILSDPEQMAKIAGLAKSLMGGEDDAPPPPGEAESDPGLLQMLGRAMNAGGKNSPVKVVGELLHPGDEAVHVHRKIRRKAVPLSRFHLLCNGPIPLCREDL